MELAPVILFAYNRPEHTRKTLEGLKKNHLASQSTLYIFVDGPKQGASVEQINKIEQVKKVVREDNWCKEVIVIESESNKGLSRSVMDGVTNIVNKFGKVIVLEDDLVPDLWFLKFMNDSLTKYENNTDVACVSGYIYPVKETMPTTFFIKGADCWGWATWKRAWDLLNTDGTALLKELEAKKLAYDFTFFNAYPYMEMLKDQITGKNNSWAILWYASTYLKDKLVLYPGKSLIQNIGVDGSGVHSATSTNFDVIFFGNEIPLAEIKVEESKIAKKMISDYFIDIYRTPKISLFRRILNRLK